MDSIRRFSTILALILAAVPVLAEESRLQVDIQNTDVVIRGFAPGSEIFLFRLLHEPLRYRSQISKYATIVSDDDRDGVITVDYGKPIPLRSLWIAFDLRTGDQAISVRKGFEVPVRPFPANGLKRGRSGELDTLEIEAPTIDVIFVRPGKGIWLRRAHQGSGDDEDGANDGKVTVTAATFKPVARSGGEPAPRAFSPGDVIVAVDPFTLEVFVTRVGP